MDVLVCGKLFVVNSKRRSFHLCLPAFFSRFCYNNVVLVVVLLLGSGAPRENFSIVILLLWDWRGVAWKILLRG